MNMIIGGKKVPASDGKEIPVINPATHKQIDTVPSATPEDVEMALDYAVRGKKIWRETTVEERVRILRKVADMMDAEHKEIARILSLEEGKPYQQAINEVLGASGLYRGYADKIRHFYGTTLPETGLDMVQIVHEPVGVVLCIIPFNFPVDLFCHKTAPALASGCPVIIKPPTETPLSVIYMTDLLLRAGIPGEVAQVVTGRGETVGSQLAASPKINAITMTGSTGSGIQIGALAIENMTRVSLELGGNDPFVVLEDADIDLCVDEAVSNRTLNAGQTCCAPKRFLVQNSVRKEFEDKVAEKLRGLKQGDPFAEDTDIGPMVSQAAAEKVHRQVMKTVEQGARIVTGGEIRDMSYYLPTLLSGVTPEMDVARDMEIFGPVIPVIGFDTEEEALEIVNRCSFGLSGGVFSKDWKKAMNFARKVESGTVVVNGAGLYRTQDMPFSGYKMSGIGSEGFFDTLKEMHTKKAIVWKNIFA